MGESGWRGVPKAERAALLVLSAAVCLACSDGVDDSPGDENGESEAVELELGSFIYECVNRSDLACTEELTAEEFPEQIAVGASFDASFTPAEETELAIDVRSGSETFVAETGSRFQAERAGQAVLVATRADDVGLGFVHVSVADMAELDIQQRSGDPPLIIMVTTEQQELRAMPLGESGSPLAGAIDFTWSSSNETVVRPMLDSPTAIMTVLAGEAGEATVTVTGNGQTADLTITVTE